MRSMVEGLARGLEKPLHHALARAVPLLVPGRISLRRGSAYIAPSSAARIVRRGLSCMELPLDRDARLRRLRFRAWHRGTREADLLVGGFFDAHAAGWSEDDMAWFEALIEEQDVDIMAWAIGTAVPPPHFEGALMQALRTVNYIEHPQ